jgi:hypothetical protein
MRAQTRPFTIVLMATLATGLILGVLARPSAGAAGADQTLDEAEAALEAAEATQEELTAQLEALEGERDQLLRDLGQRDARRERAIQDLRRARTGAQSLAVLAYMTADDGGGVLDTDELYAETLVRDSADARRQVAAYYQDLRRQAGLAVTNTTERLDDLDARIDGLRRRLDLAVDDIRGAASDLGAAQAEAEARDAAVELADLPTPPTPPSTTSSNSGNSGNSGDSGLWTPIGTVPGGPTPSQWAQLRQCESGGNYQAVSSGGAYRGAYQFDLSTWRSMGGSGDPISASPAEQDHRAQKLWQARGHAPWPVCGRHLR